MKKIILGVILLVISIISLICLGVAIGFYNQIVATGFEPYALFSIIGLISLSGIICGGFIIGVEATE